MYKYAPFALYPRVMAGFQDGGKVTVPYVKKMAKSTLILKMSPYICRDELVETLSFSSILE